MKPQEILIYTNTSGGSITFGVGSIYHVNVSKDVTGLSDLADTIYSTSSNGQDGDTVIGVRIEPRDIVIKGKIRDDTKANQLTYRRNAVKILNPKIAGTLTYQIGTYVRRIGAIVDGAPKFTHSGQLQEFEVNLKCLSPFWEEERDRKEDIATWIGDWEFPCEILRDDEQSMIFGHHEESVIVDVFNSGDITTGMRVVFRALGALSNPLLFNVNTREFLKVNIDLAAGDVLTIDTNYGRKTVTLVHNGVTTNVYRYIDVDSTFMQLDVGDNLFRYDASSGFDNLECTIYFSQKYLGV